MEFPKIAVVNQAINLPILDDKEVSLYLKREDKSHPNYGGNKVRKLKYHLLDNIQDKKTHFLTFGGAWSNHIYATAAFFNHIKQPIIGVIRGEEPASYSDTLIFAKKMGMQLHFVSREEYRMKTNPEFLTQLSQQFNNPIIIPEGGSGKFGVKGCTEILTSEDVSFDFIACPVGTGGTVAGLTLSLAPQQKIIGFSALKGGSFLVYDIHELMGFFQDQYPVSELKKQLMIETNYHFGGYAKTSTELIAFMQNFHAKTQVELDHVYTSKMMYGIIDLIAKDFFPKGSKILAIHTGGQQGLKGLEKKLKTPIYS